MMPFDLSSVINCLISNRREKYLHERAISLFQFQTWIYFSVVDAAGKLAAAAILRKCEWKAAEKISGMGRGKNISSKVLIKFLNNKEYALLYDTFFEEGGWTGLLRVYCPERFNRNIVERCKTAETVSEMIDFRFRGLDHNTLDAKQFNISRSEFYRWREHPRGELSWRTIRARWKANRSSAPFLYVSEMFGPKFSPPLFDTLKPTKPLLEGTPSQEQIREFVGKSLYVAEKINAHVFDEYNGMKSLALPPIRPKTSALSNTELDKMNFYKKYREQMRN
jgi:hypothetical protein